MSNLVLVTGGTGKTGRRLVSQLRKNGIPCRVASRGVAAAERACPFDWTQPGSWDRALEDVSSTYLVAPAIDGDPAPVMINFVKRALERGVSRFVLLSASLLPAGGPAMGQVHLWLQENAPEWTVLRPSWFMQNFSEGQHLASIRDEDRIYSAAENGRVPFVSADDIAATAMAALTHACFFNSDFVLTGNPPITYDEVAERISKAVGRAISHDRLSPDALAARYRSLGLSSLYAQTLAAMDTAIAAGMEDRVTGCVEQLTGRPPMAFDAFVEANATKWSSPVDRVLQPHRQI
jgi:ergot alkaloid biosynthesis protein